MDVSEYERDESFSRFLEAHLCDQTIQTKPDRFWEKFSNLKSLKITSDYPTDCPLFEFINTIAKKCPQLERFYYLGQSVINIVDENSYPELWQDYQKEKLSNVIDLYVTINFEDDDFSDQENQKEESIATLKSYFLNKCPQLKDKILFECIKNEIEVNYMPIPCFKYTVYVKN